MSPGVANEAGSTILSSLRAGDGISHGPLSASLEGQRTSGEIEIARRAQTSKRITAGEKVPCLERGLEAQAGVLQTGLMKTESSLATQMGKKNIGLAASLHARKAPGVESDSSACGSRRQDAKHVLMLYQRELRVDVRCWRR